MRWGVERNIYFDHLLCSWRNMIVIEIGKWSLSHAASDVRIGRMGGSFPF